MNFKRTLLLATLPLLAHTANAALLGVVPELPLFNYNSGGTTVFDGGTGTLTVNAVPTDYTPVANTLGPIFFLSVAPTISMDVSLDSDCNLAGTGDLTVMGDIDFQPQDFVPDFAGTLLTGEIVALGIGSVNTTSLSLDAKFAVTGGELVTGGEYALGSELAVTLTVEDNDYTGNCVDSWNGKAKGMIGHIEVVVPPEPPCFDVKKLKIREGRMCRSHWGSYGNSRSKIKAALSVGCTDEFDPTASLISLGLDGETFEFPIGSFTQVGTANKYRAWIAGTPRLFATLNCDKGRFSFSASRADSSQIDTDDGVDVTLVLGTTTHTQHVTVSSTGHHYWGYGHRNVFYYHNNNPENCSVMGGDDSDMHEIKCRHRHSGRIYTFKRSRGGYGKNLLVHDSHSGHFAMIDTSKSSGVTCGWSDANFEVVGIDHKIGSKSCTMMTEDGEDDDIEDNQHD